MSNLANIVMYFTVALAAQYKRHCKYALKQDAYASHSSMSSNVCKPQPQHCRMIKAMLWLHYYPSKVYVFKHSNTSYAID